MSIEQAFQVLMQALVTKQGLSVQDCATVVQAWNLLAEFIQKNKEKNNESV